MDGDDLNRALALLARAHTPSELFALGDAAAGTRRDGPAAGYEYRVGGRIAEGDLAVLYEARTGEGDAVVFKVPRDPGDNDLMRREAVALAQLAAEGEPRFQPYVPRLMESFRYRDAATGRARQVNVIRRLAGFHSLAEVRAAYPDGLDPRDVAWMWRRLLVALGFAHRATVVHGAVLPEHVLIHPEEHGLVLVDWCYSVPGCHLRVDPSRLVPAMIERYADWYPPEVPARLPASPATDIHMATLCMAYLLPDEMPRPLRMFIRGCVLPGRRARPHDAWDLLGELDEILEHLYGPRRFRPFRLPAKENPDG
jgi:hypothetical protein